MPRVGRWASLAKTQSTDSASEHGDDGAGVRSKIRLGRIEELASLDYHGRVMGAPRGRRTGTGERPGGVEWVGGRLGMPIYITEGEPRRPDVDFWLELPSGLLVTASILDPNAPQVSFADSLLRTMASPMAGDPRRPQRVRLSDARLAAEIRSAFPGLDVVVAPTPELDEILRDLVESLSKHGGEKASYFENGRVSPESVSALFQSARVLFTMAPWKTVGDGLPIRLDIPALGVEAACVSIIGGLGEHLGFLIFPSLEGFEAFRRAAERPRRRPGVIDLGTNVLSLNFERGADLPEGMRREALEQGWPIHNPDAYPQVEHRDRDASLRPLTDRDVRIVSMCALSLASFFMRNDHLLAADDFEPICMSALNDDDVEVRFTAPYHAWPLFEVNRPAGGSTERRPTRKKRGRPRRRP